MKRSVFFSVAITGIPSSGKSTVLKEFCAAGFQTIDADDLAKKEFYKKKNLAAIKKIFNTTDRRIIAEKIFSSEVLRRKLEKIIHPAVIRELKSLLIHYSKKSKPLAVEVPLLFEKKLDKLFDITITVHCKNSCAVKRLVNKKKISPVIALQMIKSHIPSTQKTARSDFVLVNKSSISLLRSISRKLAQRLLSQTESAGHKK